MTAKVGGSGNRGSLPGERRGGRKKGVPNKATGAIRDAARQYTLAALETLAQVMSNPDEPAAARVAAANALLDRGYGKPSSVVAGDSNGGPIIHTIELVPLQPSNPGAQLR